MDVYIVRRHNLGTLIDQEKNLAAFAEKIGKVPTLVSRWRSGKHIGAAIAREIEEACGLQHGWLDAQHGDLPTPAPHDLYTKIVFSAGYDPEVLNTVTAYVSKHYPELGDDLPREQYLRLIMAVAIGRKKDDPLPSVDWMQTMVALAQGQG